MENNQFCDTCGKPRSEMKDLPQGRYKDGRSYIQCKECYKAEIEKQISDFAESETSTEYEDSAICPYCGHSHEGNGESECFYQDGEVEFTCDHCNKDFKLTTNVSYSYSTYKIK